MIGHESICLSYVIHNPITKMKTGFAAIPTCGTAVAAAVGHESDIFYSDIYIT